MMLMSVILLAVILYIIYGYTQKNPGGFSPRAPETPTEIIKKRYARGEITREEYFTMKQDLES